MYYALSHAMHNTANQQVKTRCIFCGTQRNVFSKNPSDLCSLIIFPPKNMPGGTLYKKKKTRILTFISTSLKGKLQYKQKQSGYNGQSSQRIYLSDLTTNQLTSVANTKFEPKKTIFWNKKPNWNPPKIHDNRLWLFHEDAGKQCRQRWVVNTNLIHWQAVDQFWMFLVTDYIFSIKSDFSLCSLLM